MKRTNETLGHYNVLYTNSDDVIHGDVLALTKIASAFDLNEGSSTKPIRAALKEAGYEFVFNGTGSDWLCWDPKVWNARPWHHVWQIAPGAKESGLKGVPVNPPRYLMSQCLDHIASGTRHDFYTTHLTAGYATHDPGQWSKALNEYKQAAGKAGVQNIERITAGAIKQRTHSEFHHLLGDMNSQQKDTRKDWFPSQAWDGLWVPDTMPNSIDWMLHSVASKHNGLTVVKRWAEEDNKPGAKGWDSDHPAHFKTVSIPVN